MNIVYIILHYMGCKDTIECIESIYNLEKFDNNIDIVVVDNNSPDNSYDILQHKYKNRNNFHLLRNDTNLGFAKGNNVGFKYSKENLNPDFIIMLNNDTIIKQSDFNKILIEQYKKYNFDIAGPNIISVKDNKNQNPIPYKIPNKKHISKKIFKNYILYLSSYIKLDVFIKYLNKIIKINSNKKYNDYMLHGSCLIFSKKYINNYDGLCDKTFLYCEEDILKYISIRDNLNMKYINNITIFHKEDISTDLVYKNNRKKRTFYYKNTIMSLKILKDLINSNKKNILFVNHENNLGGASQALIELIDELKMKDKYNIYVFVPKFNESLPNGSLIEELKKQNINYIHFNAYWNMYPKNTSKIKNFIKQIVNVFASIRLSIYIKNKKIDIIHSNSSVTSIGLLCAFFTKKTHIYHIREFGADEENYFYVLNKEKTLKFMDKYTNAFICISKFIKEKYSTLVNADKCMLIYDGIVNIQKYKKIKIKKNKNYKILIAGRVRPTKGQFDAVKALNILIKKGYKNLKLYIVGYAEESYMKEIKKYIKDNDLSNNIIIKKYTKNLNYFREKYKIDIELSCAKKEGFGRVTVEAMQNSNPIIGLKSGATKELIIDNITGLLYNGECEDLANKIEFLICDDIKREIISKNAYKYVKENFDINKTISELEKLYDRVV